MTGSFRPVRDRVCCGCLTDPIRKSARIAYAETALYRRLQALPNNAEASD